MKEIRSKIIAVALISLLTVSVASCESVTPDSDGTVVVTNAVTNKNDSTESPATEAPVPEKDDDGSKVTVIEVTDAENKPVTNKDGSKVTELAVVDEKGAVVTDAKGKNVKPNIKVTTAAERIVENNNNNGNNNNSNNNNNNNNNNNDNNDNNNNNGNNNDNNSNNNNNNNNNNSNNNSNDNNNSNEELDNVEVRPVAEGPTLTIPKNIEAKAGEEFTFKIPVTGNTGYTGLIAWLDINEKYFEFVSAKGGDPDSDDFEDSKEFNYTTFSEYTKPDSKDIKTIICIYFDTSCKPIEGNTTYATVTLKAKKNTPAGTYDLEFDPVGDGKTMCNNVTKDKEILVPTPKYVNGSITVK